MKALYTLSLFLLMACTPAPTAPVTATDVVAFAPVTGDVSVAYLTIENHTDEDVLIASVSSPQFERVEIHETTIVDGVARMSRRSALEVPRRASVALEEGGLHLMLLDPRSPVAAGDRVSLQLQYAQGGMLIVDAVMRSRLPAGESS